MGNHLDETRTSTDSVQDHLDDHNSLHVRYNRGVAGGIINQKGDVMTFHEEDFHDRLAVGIDGQVLTAASAQELGVMWADIPSGGMTDPWEEPTPEAEDDMFNGTVMDPKWLYVPPTGGSSERHNIQLAKGALHYSRNQVGGSVVMSTYLQPYALQIGDYIQAGFSMAGEGTKGFIGLCDGDAEWGQTTPWGVYIEPYHPSSYPAANENYAAYLVVEEHPWHSQSFNNRGGSGYVDMGVGNTIIHVRFERIGATTYRGSFSRNGVMVHTTTGLDNWNVVLAPTHIGVGAMYDTVTDQAEMAIHYFNLVKV